ncbi:MULTISPECIES: hypothetical protein [Streptomyces]|uniref:Uncharacterized protein n=1 Tax=Streptomyces luteosporeus TaxID=173856 RepID=A0ABP6GIW0_9ACTN
MERQSDKHGPKKDDELKREMRTAQTRDGRPTRTEEWREPEALTPEEAEPLDEHRPRKPS